MMYFHQIYPEEWLYLVDTGITWGELAKRYCAPDWCGYGDAVEPMGCWGLIYGYVAEKGYEYCKNCELNKFTCAGTDAR